MPFIQMFLALERYKTIEVMLRLDSSTQIIFWPGPRLDLEFGKNQDQQSTVTSSSKVVEMSDSAMDTSA